MSTTKTKIFQESPLTFCVCLSGDEDRIDCAWFNPIVKNKIDDLQKNKRNDRKLVKLKCVADVKGGKRLPKGTVVIESEINNIPYIRVTDVKNQRVKLNSSIKIPNEVHHKIQNYQLQKDDVVITIVGTIGEVGILEEDVEVCDFSENIAKVRINKDAVLSNFVSHFLDSELGRIQTTRLKAGSLQFKLSLASCRNIEMYIPCDKNEYDTKAQQRIIHDVYKINARAEKLKIKGLEFINRANSIVVKKLKIPLPDENIDKFYLYDTDTDTTKRLDALFNSPVREILISNLKEHRYKKLGELAKLQSGKKIAPTDYYDLIELEQVDEKTGRIVSSREVPEIRPDKILLQSNSILIAKLQPEKRKVAIVPDKFDGAVGSSELIPIMLESEEVSLKYLWAILRSDYVLRQWAYELTGSSRMRIGRTEIEQTIIPIPDTNIQNEITREIDEMLANSDKSLRKADKLFKKAKNHFLSAVIR